MKCSTSHLYPQQVIFVSTTKVPFKSQGLILILHNLDSKHQGIPHSNINVVCTDNLLVNTTLAFRAKTASFQYLTLCSKPLIIKKQEFQETLQKESL